MKKYFIICFCLLSVLFLSSCSDERKDKNVDVIRNCYVNTTETYDVNTYNGYKCTEEKQIKNDDGSFTITFTFAKPKMD